MKCDLHVVPATPNTSVGMDEALTVVYSGGHTTAVAQH